MNEEELKKGVRKLWAAAAGTAVAAAACTAACIFAVKCGIIARTSLLPASLAWTAVLSAVLIVWTSRTPGEVWRKAMDQLNRHVVLFLGIGFCISALTDANLLQRAIKDKAKLDEISARLDEISANAIFRTDFASPTNDPPGMTLTEAASVLSNAYGRIWRTNDVDREIGRITAVSAGRPVEISGEEGNGRLSVMDLGPIPESKPKTGRVEIPIGPRLSERKVRSLGLF